MTSTTTLSSRKIALLVETSVAMNAVKEDEVHDEPDDDQDHQVDDVGDDPVREIGVDDARGGTGSRLGGPPLLRLLRPVGRLSPRTPLAARVARGGAAGRARVGAGAGSGRGRLTGWIAWTGTRHIRLPPFRAAPLVRGVPLQLEAGKASPARRRDEHTRPNQPRN